MQFDLDLIKLDRFLSSLDEELREVSRLEGLLETQRVLSIDNPLEQERILRRSKYIKMERERIQGRKRYLMKAQELIPRAMEETKANLEITLLQLKQLN